MAGLWLQIRRRKGTQPSLFRLIRFSRTCGVPGKTEEKRRSGSGGGRWSVPFGGTVVSLRRSGARVRSLVFGNRGRTEHQRRQDLFDEHSADRGALLPLMGRLPKGSAHEPPLRRRRGRANSGGEAWGRQETRHSPLNRLWRAAGGRRMRPRSGEKPALGRQGGKRTTTIRTCG
jgi:hypothetical protein